MPGFLPEIRNLQIRSIWNMRKNCCKEKWLHRHHRTETHMLRIWTYLATNHSALPKGCKFRTQTQSPRPTSVSSKMTGVSRSARLVYAAHPQVCLWVWVHSLNNHVPSCCLPRQHHKCTAVDRIVHLVYFWWVGLTHLLRCQLQSILLSGSWSPNWQIAHRVGRTASQHCGRMTTLSRLTCLFCCGLNVRAGLSPRT